jgi:hypothetical protein
MLEGSPMNRISTVLAFVVTSLAVFGCAAASDPEGEPQPAESTSEQALTTVGSSGGDTGSTGTVSTTKPSSTTASCVSGCLTTHISTGWCQAYCDCRVLFKKSINECSQHASMFFIDI